MRETLRLVVFLLGGAFALARAKGSTSVDDSYEGGAGGGRSKWEASLILSTTTTRPELPTNNSHELSDISGMHHHNMKKNVNPRNNSKYGSKEFEALLGSTTSSSTPEPEQATNNRPELPDFSGMHKIKNFNPPNKNGSNNNHHHDEQEDESSTRSPKADRSTGKKDKMSNDNSTTKQPVKSKKKSKKAATGASKKDGKKLSKKSSKKSSSGKETLSPTSSPTTTIAPTSTRRPTGAPSGSLTVQPSTKPSTPPTQQPATTEPTLEPSTLAPSTPPVPLTLAPTFGTPTPTSPEPDTLAPTERDQDCSVLLDECCVDSDCDDSQVCANRNCVQQGCPQFTLTWTGRTDHDLFVTVPSGGRISSMNRFDPDSGGAWEGETFQDRQFGYYAENVYFPTSCTSPPGIYQYFLFSEADDEEWTISVSNNGDVQSTVSGKGPSEKMEYVVHGAESVFPTSTPASDVPTSTPTTPSPSSVLTSNSPSSAPSSECQNPRYECCSDEECLVDGTACANRNCVVQGAMRFTLTWFGLDDKDLQVQAPGGQPINAANPVDPVSGGKLEENIIPTEFEYHAENIFFPTDRPITPGDYQVLLKGNLESEPWTITLTIDSIEVASLTGTDLSRFLVVEVAAPPSKCDPSVNECCMDDDCQDGFACASRNCVMVGYPRFTLTWLGSDDKDLIVTTPDGTDIFFDNVFDPVSGGRLEDDVVPDGFDFYAENIYFPVDGSAPAGVYEYLVKGGGEEAWNVSVALNYTVVDNVSGVGDQMFTYQFGQIAPTSVPVPTSAPSGFTSFPTGQCSSLEDQCCENEDCGEGFSCSNRNCVRNGNPRFTLTWVGEGDKDIRVRTPDGTLIFFQNTFDPVSGGMLEKDVVPDGFGFYAENIYFPIIDGSAPTGDYLYGVSGSVEAWELSVYLGDDLVDVKSGTGPSEDFTYEFGTCDREEVECCTDVDCRNSSGDNTGDICVSSNCIADGVLRFTLIWEGDDDKDIAVVLPNNNTINFQTPVDEESGCRLERDTQPVERGNYVENIYCPPGSSPPLGSYIYTATGRQELWTLEVYVDGKLASSESGRGNSPDLVFELQQSVS